MFDPDKAFKLPVPHIYPDGSVRQIEVQKHVGQDSIVIIEPGAEDKFVILCSRAHTEALIHALQVALKVGDAV